MAKTHKALKLRLYPTKDQQEFLDKNLGSCRAIFNMMLYERQEVYSQLKDDKEALKKYKYKTESQYKQEYEWLKEADSTSLQQARIDLTNAYKNFFNGLSGKYKNKYGFPKFRKKKIGSSYRVPNNGGKAIEVNFKTRKVKLPKVGWISFRDKRLSFDGVIKSATVRRTATGKYFVSVLFEQELNLSGNMIDDSLKNKAVGLDMSLESFFVDNNGNSPAYERLYRKYEPKLKKAQRQMSKKKKGSKNWYKALHKVNLIHEKISNKRKDFTNKLSTKLVSDYDLIIVENLSLKGMSQALRLGKSVMDLGYSDFIRQLNYKALHSNKIFIKADKWFASSKACSVCGFVNKKLELSDRNWACPNCGSYHDRDQNAGVNLKNYGLEFLGLGQPDFKPVEKESADSDFGRSQDSSEKQEKVSEIIFETPSNL